MVGLIEVNTDGPLVVAMRAQPIVELAYLFRIGVAVRKLFDCKISFLSSHFFDVDRSRLDIGLIAEALCFARSVKIAE